MGRTPDRGLTRLNITPSSERIWGTSTLRVLLEDFTDCQLDYIDNCRALNRRATEVHLSIAVVRAAPAWSNRSHRRARADSISAGVALVAGCVFPKHLRPKQVVDAVAQHEFCGVASRVAKSEFPKAMTFGLLREGGQAR